MIGASPSSATASQSLHPLWRGVPVGPPQVGPGRVAGAVAVLYPGLGFVHRAGAHVHANVGLSPDDATVLDELVGAEAVRLLGVPGELRAPGAVGGGAHSVEPVVAADEVAAGPPQDRNRQGSHGLQDVPPEAALVAQRRALLIDAAVDAATEVLDE